MVNYIKSRPLNTRLFANLCNELGSEHQGLLFHTEVRWLSRGNVLSRQYELQDEAAIFQIKQKATIGQSVCLIGNGPLFH
ncbi:hypothetical protein JOQ06_026842 [Pogonophryne albipinna]|uniref:Uncharacterized protein n=1 Tax=Pogonophryne albipinna TaxID=1090488 RepID=A0AAD6BAW7_9TELE|nr:hypothetical protein JOQ06_026842 [Pogonophryne albipinna]